MNAAYAAAASAATTAGAAMILIRAAPRLGLVDVPDARRRHATPVPRIGGLAVAAGTAAGMMVFLAAGGGAPGVSMRVAAGAVGALLLGAIDDRLRDRFPAAVKFAAQAALAAAFAATAPGAEPVSACGAAVLIVASMNAFNFFDHADGLLAIAALPAAATPLLAGDAAPPLASALAVFLAFNLRRRAFGGDALSQSVGFAVAATCLDSFGDDARGVLLAMGAAAPLPLLDLAVVCALRLRAGVPPWRATHVHFANRLQDRGRPRWVAPAMAALWGAAAWQLLQADGGHGVARVFFWPASAALAALLILCTFVRGARPRTNADDASSVGV